MCQRSANRNPWMGYRMGLSIPQRPPISQSGGWKVSHLSCSQTVGDRRNGQLSTCDKTFSGSECMPWTKQSHGFRQGPEWVNAGRTQYYVWSSSGLITIVVMTLYYTAGCHSHLSWVNQTRETMTSKSNLPRDSSLWQGFELNPQPSRYGQTYFQWATAPPQISSKIKPTTLNCLTKFESDKHGPFLGEMPVKRFALLGYIGLVLFVHSTRNQLPKYLVSPSPT